MAASAIWAVPWSPLRWFIPPGTITTKVHKLLALLNWQGAFCGDELWALSTVETGTLRRQLLSVRGVGPENADAILLRRRKTRFCYDA
jgi:endonuclease III-like uncharacterized protein